MVPRLPVMSGQDAVKAFSRGGWKVVRQHGSHVIMTKPASEVTLSIPQHRELKKGLLVRLIKDAGFERDEFLALL